MTTSNRLRRYDDIRGLLGSRANPTPMVRLNHVAPARRDNVYLGLERFNSLLRMLGTEVWATPAALCPVGHPKDGLLAS